MPVTPEFRRTLDRRFADAVVTRLTRRGWAPATAWLLTTTGRRTGLARTVPVTVPVVGGVQHLVAPFGPVAWVNNVRADARVELRRGRTSASFVARELTADEAAPVLAEYVRIAPPVRRFFTARPGDSVDAFAAEAARHPVFALVPVPVPDNG